MSKAIQSDVPYKTFLFKFDSDAKEILLKHTNFDVMTLILSYLPDPTTEIAWDTLNLALGNKALISTYWYCPKYSIDGKLQSMYSHQYRGRLGLVKWLNKLACMEHDIDASFQLFEIAHMLKLQETRLMVVHPLWMQVENEYVIIWRPHGMSDSEILALTLVNQ